MKLNRIEKALMNNPVRSLVQRWHEARLLERLGGHVEGARVLEVEGVVESGPKSFSRNSARGKLMRSTLTRRWLSRRGGDSLITRRTA